MSELWRRPRRTTSISICECRLRQHPPAIDDDPATCRRGTKSLLGKLAELWPGRRNHDDRALSVCLGQRSRAVNPARELPDRPAVDAWVVDVDVVAGVGQHTGECDTCALIGDARPRLVGESEDSDRVSIREMGLRQLCEPVHPDAVDGIRSLGEERLDVDLSRESGKRFGVAWEARPSVCSCATKVLRPDPRVEAECVGHRVGVRADESLADVREGVGVRDLHRHIRVHGDLRQLGVQQAHSAERRIVLADTLVQTLEGVSCSAIRLTDQHHVGHDECPAGRFRGR